MEKIMRVVVMASGRVFVGPELCRNEEYITCSMNYTIDLMDAVRAVSETAPWLRPFVAGKRPEVKKIHRCADELLEIIGPVIVARRDDAANDPDYQKPDDLLQWNMDAPSRFGRKDDKELANVQLSASFAAIHTTSTTATNA